MFFAAHPKNPDLGGVFLVSDYDNGTTHRGIAFQLFNTSIIRKASNKKLTADIPGELFPQRNQIYKSDEDRIIIIF